MFEFGGDGLPLCRNFNLGVFTTTVDGSIVHVDDILALLAIALERCILHIFDGVLCRDDA